MSTKSEGSSKWTSKVGAEDVLLAAGTGLVSYGAWSIYQPAGFLVGGALLLAAGVLIARAGAQ